MSNLLQQLENNEAVLLMYMAGELPDADRAEVEQMLAADPALRASLAEMTSMHDHMIAMLSQADSALHLSRREAAVRQVSLAINQAKVDGLRAPAPASHPARSRTRIPVWAYPVAAAALLVIGIMIFNGQHPTAAPGPEPAKNAIVMADYLPHSNPDDLLSQGEKEANEVASLRNTSSSNFGGADPLDWDR